MTVISNTNPRLAAIDDVLSHEIAELRRALKGNQ